MVSYWSGEHPFIDRFKASGAWNVMDPVKGWTPVAALDANGYPTASPANGAVMATMFDVDPLTAGTSNTYVLTYRGHGDVNVQGNILSRTDGRIVFEATRPDSQNQLTLLNDDASNPVTDIHIVRQDQQALYDAGEIFNPAFISKLSGWDALRFKDWTATDNSDLTSWSQRTTLSDGSWSSFANKAGVPIEVQVALANETHSAMWVSLPAAADDDYVQRTLGYVHDHLAKGLAVNVEYSNEVWNWGYSQARYAGAQGDRLWGTDANHDGRIDGNDPAEHVGDGWMQYYGYRSAQVAAIAKQVFADDPGRVNTVVATQTAWEGLENATWTGVAKAGAGSADQLFDSYAVTTYFGGDLDGYVAGDQAKVLAWARGGSAGMDAAFRQLEHGTAGLADDQSLDHLATVLAYQARVAASKGLNLVAYEGGAHLTAIAYDPSVQAEVTAFFQKLQDDPRMGALYAKMAADFAAAGGTLLAAFQDTGQSNAWGDFGMLTSVYDQGSARFDALRAVQGSATSAPANAAPGAGTQPITISFLDAADHQVSGAAGADRLTVGGGNNWIVAGGGADTVVAGDGNNHVWGNGSATAGQSDGADTITLGGGTNYVNGNAGDDVITVGRDGSTGANRVLGGAGNDLLVVQGAGNNYANGNLGADRLDASAATGNNLLRGGQGDDLLRGGHGHDQLMGDIGNDTLVAGSGAGHLSVMTGGTGADLFVFHGAQGAVGWNNQAFFQEVTDYQPGTDHLAIGFQPAGVANGGAFADVAAAQGYAQGWLAGHGGQSVVAAQVGGDTFLFYDAAGTTPTLDAMVRLDHVQATSLSTADFVAG